MLNADMRDSFHLFERCDLDEDILGSDVLTVLPSHRNMPHRFPVEVRRNKAERVDGRFRGFQNIVCSHRTDMFTVMQAHGAGVIVHENTEQNGRYELRVCCSIVIESIRESVGNEIHGAPLHDLVVVADGGREGIFRHILGADDFLTGFEFFLHTGNDFEAFALAEFIGEFFFSAADYDIMAQCTGAALSDNTQIEFFRIDG